MQTVPVLLGLLLVVLGIIVRVFQKAPIEKWVGYNVIAAGLLILAEVFLGSLCPQLESRLPAINLATLILICLVMIIGFGKYGEKL